MPDAQQKSTGLSKMQIVNLALRGLMEAGIVSAFGYWGYQTGGSFSMKILLCIATPLIGFGFWGIVDFKGFGKYSEYLRLTQELLICVLAAIALYKTGAQILGIAFLILSVIHHVLVYLMGETLLKE